MLQGLPASPGLAAGRAVILDAPTGAETDVPLAERPATALLATRALQAAADELEALAPTLARRRRRDPGGRGADGPRPRAAGGGGACGARGRPAGRRGDPRGHGRARPRCWPPCPTRCSPPAPMTSLRRPPGRAPRGRRIRGEQRGRTASRSRRISAPPTWPSSRPGRRASRSPPAARRRTPRSSPVARAADGHLRGPELLTIRHAG